jgi:hypothetical protein
VVSRALSSTADNNRVPAVAGAVAERRAFAASNRRPARRRRHH